MEAFAEKVSPVIADWQAHLKKNHATAAQVLRKLTPHRMTVTPTERGGWTVTGETNYSAILKECGYDAVESVIMAVSKQKGSRVRRAARTEPRTE
jgi:ABC-type Fe3+-hydroxamate transport system substrate-binding protein